MSMFENLSHKIVGKGIRVVFPEGYDERIQGAVDRLKQYNLVEPVVLGNPDELRLQAAERGFDLDDVEIINPATYDGFEEMVQAFVERRKGKTTEEQARELCRDENYFGTMLVYMDKVDALVSGAAHSTSDTVRPALQIIKTKPGVKLTSGAFIMTRDDERYVFADCAINIHPNAQELAEIAVETAMTATMFDIDPKVAMLSFSTYGSACCPEQERVAEATKLAQQMAPHYAIDGELQFDAAFVPSVGKRKAPGSEVAGHANVFIFPDIQSGNIGYKIAQRLGGFDAVGPILQGMNKPISDLSRGCTEEDVFKLAIITANQTLLS